MLPAALVFLNFSINDVDIIRIREYNHIIKESQCEVLVCIYQFLMLQKNFIYPKEEFSFCVSKDVLKVLVE